MCTSLDIEFVSSMKHSMASSEMEQQLIVLCEKGWTLDGPKKKKCLGSGFWDPEEKVKCMENNSVKVYFNSCLIFLLILLHTIN